MLKPFVTTTVADARVHFAKVRSMRHQVPQLLRSDAEDNRERLLDAARTLFAERGLDVTMRQIARQAGVGPATLYRRFPTKQALIDVAFRDELDACKAIVAVGCADLDPWRGLRMILLRLGELNARNHGFVDAFVSSYPDAVDFTAHRTGLLRSLAELCGRAQASGVLRADFVFDDVLLIIMAGRGISAVNAEQRVIAARRFSALAVEALRAR
jgi:AcrR family transcriptional regulator